MNMIGHDQIEPDTPRVGIGTCPAKSIMKWGIRQIRLSRLNGKRDKKNDRHVVQIDRLRMHGMVALGPWATYGFGRALLSRIIRHQSPSMIPVQHSFAFPIPVFSPCDTASTNAQPPQSAA